MSENRKNNRFQFSFKRANARIIRGINCSRIENIEVRGLKLSETLGKYVLHKHKKLSQHRIII